ncbi:MAG: bifunctional 2-polyprenyl-6-hydroxyphenol methylase/3-demethylubiquinol 3-O-methyltransferase UbiG [Magnetospiraceae bacterium]
MVTAQATEVSGTAAPEEVARFTAMADEWWDPDGKFKPLHKFNPVRLNYIKYKLAKHFGLDPAGRAPLEGLRILDIGCGGGLVAEPVSLMGAEVLGIDASEKNTRIAATHAAETGAPVTYAHRLPEEMAAAGDRFDVVLNLEVVEHVPDVGEFMGVCSSLVKPGGVMLCATLNRTLKSLALAKIGAEYVLRWLPQGTHDWRKFVKPSELAASLRAHGLNVDDLTGVSFNPLVDAWSLSRDLEVNYLAFATKPAA